MSSPLRLSADGLFYWDGTRWVSALSPDGRQRWDGNRWVPIQQAPPPPLVYQPMPFAVPAPKPPRVPTKWTTRLQYTVAAAFAIYGLYTLLTPFWLYGPMNDYMRQVALRQAARAPELYPDPTSYANTMSTIGVVSLGIGIAIAVTIAVVGIIGALRRWTWMHYAVLVVIALFVLGLPAQVLNALGVITVSAMPLPAAGIWIGITFGVLLTALGAWMLVVLLRVGPWATRRSRAQ